MTVTEKPRPDEWMVGDDAADRLALFLEVGDTMRAGARKGIRGVLRSVPSEHDVEEVVVQSFNELLRKDHSRVESDKGDGPPDCVSSGLRSWAPCDAGVAQHPDRGC